MGKIKNKLKPYQVDQYDVINYNTFYLLLAATLLLYAIISLLSIPLYMIEATVEHSNIKNFKDAFWTLQMSASTIGFGDFYPVTLMGRMIVALMFYIGVGMVGFIGAQFVNKVTGFSDTNIKNRELKKQNNMIIAQNTALEKRLEHIISYMDIPKLDEAAQHEEKKPKK